MSRSLSNKQKCGYIIKYCAQCRDKYCYVEECVNDFSFLCLNTNFGIYYIKRSRDNPSVFNFIDTGIVIPKNGAYYARLLLDGIDLKYSSLCCERDKKRLLSDHSDWNMHNSPFIKTRLSLNDDIERDVTFIEVFSERAIINDMDMYIGPRFGIPKLVSIDLEMSVLPISTSRATNGGDNVIVSLGFGYAIFNELKSFDFDKDELAKSEGRGRAICIYKNYTDYGIMFTGDICSNYHNTPIGAANIAYNCKNCTLTRKY